MLQGKIEAVARIVRSLDPVAYPPPAPPSLTGADLAALFEERLDALRAPRDVEPAVIHVDDASQAARSVAELCQGIPDQEIIWTGRGEGRPIERRDYMAGITPASALIAATGTVVLELAQAEEGYSSLLVDRHLVVAHRGQLLPDLETFYRGLSDRCEGGEKLSNRVCITGCSRTADIEKLLVVPAHGPRHLQVVLSKVPVDWGAFIAELAARREGG